jgi:hypothetical protein
MPRRPPDYALRLVAMPWIASGVLLLRIAGLGSPGGFAHELERDPVSTVLAGALGVVAFVLAALLAIAPARRLQEVSFSCAVMTGIGGCVLALDGHESALLVIGLAALTAAASAVSRRFS